MISLEKIQDQLSALIAGVNSCLAGQELLLRELKTIEPKIRALLESQQANDYTLNGKLDGIRDGLADEIAKLKREGVQMAPETVELWKSVNLGLHRLAKPRKPDKLLCGTCNKDFDHCNCKVFAAQKPGAKRKRR